jgi:hypothetical protein
MHIRKTAGFFVRLCVVMCYLVKDMEEIDEYWANVE